MKDDIDDQPPKFYIAKDGRLWKDCRVQNFNFAVFEGFTEQSVPEEIWVACRSDDKYPDDLGLVVATPPEILHKFYLAAISKGG